MTEKSPFAGAEKRQAQWESMGCPVTRGGQCIRDYNDLYRHRIDFANSLVMEQATQHLRIILCPACVVTDTDLRTHCSIMFITIEDDVMTTWPAMGHFTCHHCGFDEWHPLKHDPRATGSAGQSALQAAALHQHQAIGMAHNLGGLHASAGFAQQQSARMQQLQNAYNAAQQQKANSQQLQHLNEEYRRARDAAMRSGLNPRMVLEDLERILGIPP